MYGAAAAVLCVHTLNDEIRSWSWGQSTTVDQWSLGLIGLMGLAVLLPYVRSIKFGKEGFEAKVDRAAAATKKALTAADAEAAPPPPPTAAQLEVVTSDPLASLERSRRLLASSLGELAAANTIKQSGTLEELAKSVEGEGPTRLNSKTREAITELAHIIKEAKADSRASAGLALEVDYATQFLTSEFQKRTAAAKAASAAS